MQRLGAHPAYEPIKLIYNDKFPFEVHFAYAEWIEERIRQDQVANLENHPAGEQRAFLFMQSLCEELLKHDRSQFIGQDYQIPNIEEVSRNFINKVQFNAVAMYNEIHDRLRFLDDFLHHPNEKDQIAFTINENESRKINGLLSYVVERVLALSELKNQYNLEMERLQTLEYNERVDLDNILRALTDHIEVVVNALARAQCYVIFKPLAEWKRGQALAGNGVQLPQNAIDEIQMWFERLTELIWSTRNVIGAIRHHNSVLDKYFNDTTNILILLIESGFVVKDQPPQVLMINTK